MYKYKIMGVVDMKNIKMSLIIIAGILSVALLFVFVLNGTQNKAIGLEKQIKVANSDIKVQEKRRVDYNSKSEEDKSKIDKYIVKFGNRAFIAVILGICLFIASLFL